MSEALFFEHPKEEKINSEYFVMSPSANPRHQEIIVNLTTIFNIHIKKNKKPCKVYGDGIDVHLGTDSYVIPDVSVICDLENIKPNGFHGIPKLIVEVLSPSSITHDTETKFNLYEKHGVSEFWLADYNNCSITQCILENGKYTKKIFVLLDEFEFERLSEKEKKVYTTKFETFDNLEIDLRDIFE